jgi:DNA-directed RNA polymerase subunit RPC12/RpoP
MKQYKCPICGEISNKLDWKVTDKLDEGCIVVRCPKCKALVFKHHLEEYQKKGEDR